MDGAIGFNRSIYTLEQCSDGSLGCFLGGINKTRKSVTSLFISPQPGMLSLNGRKFVVSNKFRCAIERNSNHRWSACVDGLKPRDWIIGDVIAYRGATSRYNRKWMVPLNSACRICQAILWRGLLMALGSICGRVC